MLSDKFASFNQQETEIVDEMLLHLKILFMERITIYNKIVVLTRAFTFTSNYLVKIHILTKSKKVAFTACNFFLSS
ncbi:MAG: hypothetical protein PHH37_00105 [Paludibacter sp.]|nr:hypothetical protein [Paludibacter sp.]